MNLTAEIIIKRREVYGVERFYIVSFHKEPIRLLTGRETVTETDIKALKALGYTFKAETVNIPL